MPCISVSVLLTPSSHNHHHLLPSQSFQNLGYRASVTVFGVSTRTSVLRGLSDPSILDKIHSFSCFRDLGTNKNREIALCLRRPGDQEKTRVWVSIFGVLGCSRIPFAQRAIVQVRDFSRENSYRSCIDRLLIAKS